MCLDRAVGAFLEKNDAEGGGSPVGPSEFRGDGKHRPAVQTDNVAVVVRKEDFHAVGEAGL